MATGIGTRADMVIYNDQYYSGKTEIFQQKTSLFNQNSFGAIQLISSRIKGDYEQEAFFKEMSGMASYRDPNSTATATAQKLETGEHVGVKVPRKNGPIEDTADRWRRTLQDPETGSRIIGEQAAIAQRREYLNTALMACVAALTASTGLSNVHDGTAGTVTKSGINAAKFKLGDAMDRIVMMVMHSKVLQDLTDQALTDKLYGEIGLVVYGAQVGTMNVPWMITDSDALVTAGAPDTYHTLLLTENAITVTESEEDELYFMPQGGKENITYLYQEEYAFNLKIKGVSWNIATGGANPTDAALATSANWTQAATDKRALAGVLLNTQ